MDNTLIAYTVLSTGDIAFYSKQSRSQEEFDAFVRDLMEEAPHTIVYWDNILYINNIDPRHLTAELGKYDATLQMIEAQRQKANQTDPMTITQAGFEQRPILFPQTSSAPTSSAPDQHPPIEWEDTIPQNKGLMVGWIRDWENLEENTLPNSTFMSWNEGEEDEYAQTVRNVLSDPNSLIVYLDGTLYANRIRADWRPHLLSYLAQQYTQRGYTFNITDHDGNLVTLGAPNV